VKARSKFLIGGLLILGSSGLLMASSARETAQYFLTPTELASKIADNPRFVNTGVKVGAAVVNGTIVRAEDGRSVTFQMTDSTTTYNVIYRGVIPDTFTEGVEVVVEGRLNDEGTFEATTLLAKCASRYENEPDRPGASPYPSSSRYPASQTSAS
jgi:cytochrome c-type biogenesis protein CcmE